MGICSALGGGGAWGFMGTEVFRHLSGIGQALQISLFTRSFTAGLCDREVPSQLKRQGLQPASWD